MGDALLFATPGDRQLVRGASSWRWVLVALLVLAAPAQAQLGNRPGPSWIIEGNASPECEHEAGLDGVVGEVNQFRGSELYTVASLRDSRGRCTLTYYNAPLDDALTRAVDGRALRREAASFGTERGGQIYLGDSVPSDYDAWKVVDRYELRMGYVVMYKSSTRYWFFDRYGALTYMAAHTTGDQFALVNAQGQSVGAIYSADPPRPSTAEERIITRFPFVYNYEHAAAAIELAPQPARRPLEVVVQRLRPEGLPCHREGQDRRGRCAIDPAERPYRDELAGPEPSFDTFRSRAGSILSGQLDPGPSVPSPYRLFEIRSPDNERLGYVAWHPQHHDYVYFTAGGKAQAIALHVAEDQWALYGGEGGTGVLYGRNVMEPTVQDRRMLTLYPFLFGRSTGG